LAITWFSDFRQYQNAVERARPLAPLIEDYLVALGTSAGYCSNCEAIGQFQVDVGVRLGEYASLREGMRCVACGMNNRTRLLLDAIKDTLSAHPAPKVALLEAVGPLYAAVARRWPELASSEFFGREHAPGTLLPYRGRQVAHQDATHLSYADGSFDLLAHNDVLEHIFNYRLAMREAMRVLAPGGALVFGVPFFYDLEKSQVRGIEAADGTVTDIEPPEYHGDGVREGGIYTFYHYGWDMIGAMQAAGFTVELGFAYDVFFGYVSNNHRYGGHGLMFPTVIRARKPG
jgi:SAM-dependent methyltransferase